jgi:hypothetical protein
MIITTNNGTLALGLEQANYVEKYDTHSVIDGNIVPRRLSNGEDVLTAQRTTGVGTVRAVSGQYKVNFLPPVIEWNENPLPAITVSGNQILSGGNPILLKGLSTASIGNEWTGKCAILRLTQTIHSFPQCNIIRFPCQPNHLSDYGVADFITYWLDPAVAWCQQNGFYCIIDWHEIGSWNTTDVNTRFRAFWDLVAPRYKDLTHVLYELFNEPDGPHDGFQASSWNNFKPTMQTWVDHIKTMAPDTALIVGSPLFDQYTQYIPANPITGSNIIYTHPIYPNHLPGGSVVDFQGNPVADTNLATKTAWMDTNFGNAANTIPVILTEWGYALTDVGFYLLQAKSRASFAEPLMDYCESKGIHWTAWSLDPLSAPAMQTGDELNDFGQFVSGILQ